MVSKPTDRSGFRFSIICALPIEYDAVHDSLDEVWTDRHFRGVRGDANRYVTGRMGDIPVVLVLLPGGGTNSAASAAATLRTSFVNIQYALLVGICGAAPNTPRGAEIVLGDVIIGKYVVQYDFGGQHPHGFSTKNRIEDTLGRPTKEVRVFNAMLETRSGRGQLKEQTTNFLSELQEKLASTEDCGVYDYRGTQQDKLFQSTYRHKHHDPAVCNTCEKCSGPTDPVCDDLWETSCSELNCNEEGLVVRKRHLQAQKLEAEGQTMYLEPAIHLGGIASGNTVMLSSYHRDLISRRDKVIAFEMEGAGMWDELDCLVIKGVCDYADSHKNKGWQNYAAATAAAAAKAVLYEFDRTCDIKTENTSSIQVCHFIPCPKNEELIGRGEVITKILDLLFVKKKKKVSLTGLGGIGKTQVAREVAHKAAETMENMSVFWMPAFSMAGYEQACSELVKTLQLPSGEDNDAKLLVKEYLESKSSGEWLFILDNADDEKILHDSEDQKHGVFSFLPRKEGGRLLVTTRYRRIAAVAAKHDILDLQKMSLLEATNLFQSSAINQVEMESEEVMLKLFEQLCYLPLAISQAANYININQISISDYLRLCQESAQDMTQLMSAACKDDTYYHESQSAVATTWLISFNQIKDNNFAAARILSFIAWIEPKAIPDSIIPDVGTAQEKTEAIGTLQGYGFLSRRSDERMFDMHSLVHLVMQRQLKERNEEYDRTEILSHLNRRCPVPKWENRHVCGKFLPHILRVFWMLKDEKLTSLARFGYRIGQYLYQQARYPEAIAIFEHVVAIEMKIFAEDDPDRLSSQCELAKAYRANGQIEKAVELLEYVAIKRSILAEDNPNRLASQHELAKAYLANAEIEKAIELLEYVVAIKRNTLAEDNPSRLTSQHNLATAYQANGQIEKAVELLEYVAAIERNILAEDDPNRLTSQQALARAYQANGQIEKAVELLEHVVAKREALAEDHSSRLISQHNLATVYYQLGRLEDAVCLMKQVIAIREQSLAESHPHRIKSQKWLEIIMESVSNADQTTPQY